MISKEIRQENSIPVQSRTSLVSLANLEVYWEREGRPVRTLSQLVSWSVDLLVEILKSNNILPDAFDSVTEANKHLQMKRLYQPSLHKRSLKKIGNAITFENLRGEGINPKDYAPRQYNVVHNRQSVEPLEMGVVNDYNPPRVSISKEEIERTKRAIEEHRNRGTRSVKTMSMEEVREETLRIAEKAGVFNSSLKNSMNDCQVNQEQEAQGGSGMPRSIDNKEAQGNTGIPNTFNSINKTNKQEVQSASGITSVEGEGGKTSTVKEGMTDEELREKMERDDEKLREEERANEEFLKSLKQQS